MTKPKPHPPKTPLKLLPDELEIRLAEEDLPGDTSNLIDNFLVRALKRLNYKALSASANLVYITNGQITKCYLTDWTTMMVFFGHPNPDGPSLPFVAFLTALESEDQLNRRWEKINKCIENSPATISLS